MKYRAGVIGCGRIGCSFDEDPKRKYVATHAGAYYSSDRTELAALADLSSEKLERYGSKYGIPRYSLYTDYIELLKRERLDIVSICTWSSTHRQIVEAAVREGVKAVFCEKPIADTLSDAREMVELCEKAGVILMVDHQRRFDMLHQEVKGFIETRGIGAIQQAHVYYTAGLANTGSHVFDYLRFFLGDVACVQATFSRAPSPNPDDPNLDGIVFFRNGTVCALQALDVGHFLMLETDMIGTSGRISLTHSGFDVEYYEVKDSNRFSGYKELFRTKPPFDVSEPKNFIVNAVEHICECITEGQPPISSGRDGAAALELICAFHESASRDGARVPLPLKDSNVIIKSR